MKKILITGASGFLGANFCRIFSEQYELHGTYNANAPDLPGVQLHRLDLKDEEAVEKLLREIIPEGIIHLAALSDPNACERDPELSEQVNVYATEVLAALAVAGSIPFVFASTDLVFSGEEAPYSEDAVPAPVNIYGIHKAIAETLVQDLHPEAVICRLPLMYGAATGAAKSFLQPLLESLAAGNEVKLFRDEYRSVASAADIAEALLLCLQKGEGIYHLGGPERLSRLEMGEQVCQVYGFDKALLIATRQKDVKMPAARPADVSFSSERTRALGWSPGIFREEIMKLKQQEEQLLTE